MKFRVGDKVKMIYAAQLLTGIIVEINPNHEYSMFSGEKRPYRVKFDQYEGYNNYLDHELKLIKRNNNWNEESI